MRIRKPIVIMLCGLGMSLGAQADDFGMLMDLQGSLQTERGGKPAGVDVGDTVNVGDKLSLAQGAKATIIAYSDCTELLLQGPVTATVESDEIKVSTKEGMRKGKTMPVCYSPEDLNTADSGVIGGLVLRGDKKDPVADLRAEFDGGKATSSTLITLIMHDLSNGDIERARPYFDKLKKDTPNSPFVARIAHQFAAGETKQP